MCTGKGELEWALINGLKKEWSRFADFTIHCSNGSVAAPRMLLELSSRYFQGLFRTDPTAKDVHLPQYKADIIGVLVKSIVDFAEEDFDQIDLVCLLQASDYLQMDTMIKVISSCMSKNLSLDNIGDLFCLLKTYQSPSLEKACLRFMRNHLNSDIALEVLASQSEENIVFVCSEPFAKLYDKFGRKLCHQEIALVVTNLLHQICQAKNENFVRYFRKALVKNKRPSRYYDEIEDNSLTDFTLAFLQAGRSDVDSEALQMFAKSIGIQSLDLGELVNPELVAWIKDNWIEAKSEIPLTIEYSNTLARCQDVDAEQTAWSLEGCIRKIDILMKNWQGQVIILALVVYLDDGVPHKLGVDQVTDEYRVVSLDVPAGEHIKHFRGRSDSFLHQIGFVTNTGFESELVGTGDHGEEFTTQQNSPDDGDDFRLRFMEKDYCNDGLRGVTVQTQFGPCICEIEFRQRCILLYERAF